MNKPTKSARLGLTFPYDWSNPNISDEALILNVLARGLFEDICRICVYFGIGEVERIYTAMPPPAIANPALPRILSNIKQGFARAQSR